MRVKHTLETNTTVRIGGTEFPEGQDHIDLEPRKALKKAAASDKIELVADVPTDYDTLQAIAMRDDVTRVDGNSPKLDILEFLDSIGPRRRGELIDSVTEETEEPEDNDPLGTAFYDGFAEE